MSKPAKRMQIWGNDGELLIYSQHMARLYKGPLLDQRVDVDGEVWAFIHAHFIPARHVLGLAILFFLAGAVIGWLVT